MLCELDFFFCQSKRCLLLLAVTLPRQLAGVLLRLRPAEWRARIGAFFALWVCWRMNVEVRGCYCVDERIDFFFLPLLPWYCLLSPTILCLTICVYIVLRV